MGKLRHKNDRSYLCRLLLRGVMFNHRAPQHLKAIHKDPVPILILGDKRTIAIASAILQGVTQSVCGTSNVTASKPAVFKSHLYASILQWIHESPERLKEVERFFCEEWSALPIQRKEHTIPLRWSVTAHRSLTEIGKRLHKQSRRGNKSLAFCVIMAFAAKYRYGVAIPQN